jgi:hypothetical protein
MAEQEPFRLTMGPLDSGHVDRLLAKATALDHSHSGFWVSGDYEAATDNLHPTLSEECIEEIVDLLRIPLEDGIVLRRALTGHMIHWVGSSVDRVERRQNWGQLMGSPISFPVLCLVNAAITRFWFEIETGRKWKLSEMPLLVNGDDILFWCPSKDAYRRWKAWTEMAGLKPSIGKNYTSSKYLIINSQIFGIRKSIDFFGAEVWENTGDLPCMNFGLLTGEVKSGSSHAAEKTMFGTHELQRDSFRQRAHDWCDGFPEDRDLMNNVFINQNREVLRGLPEGISWWVHPRLGGLGLPVTREVNITTAQRKLAAMLYLDPSHRDSVKGLTMPLPEFTQRLMSDWKTLLRKLGVELVRGGRYKVPSGFGLLGYYLETGFDPSDPQGLSNWTTSVRRVMKAARKHWAKPLSFHNCVVGPCEEWGINYRVGGPGSQF